MDSVFFVWLIMCGVAFGIFLAMRMFWLWYFGTSQIIALLTSIDHSLHQLPAVQDHLLRKHFNKAA